MTASVPASWVSSGRRRGGPGRVGLTATERAVSGRQQEGSCRSCERRCGRQRSARSPAGRRCQFPSFWHAKVQSSAAARVQLPREDGIAVAEPRHPANEERQAQHSAARHLRFCQAAGGHQHRAAFFLQRGCEAACRHLNCRGGGREHRPRSGQASALPGRACLCCGWAGRKAPEALPSIFSVSEGMTLRTAWSDGPRTHGGLV